MNFKRTAFKEQIDKFLSTKFYVTTSQDMRKTPKQDNYHVMDIIIFYYNSKSLIFKVLGVVVYFFIEKCLC